MDYLLTDYWITVKLEIVFHKCYSLLGITVDEQHKIFSFWTKNLYINSCRKHKCGI